MNERQISVFDCTNRSIGKADAALLQRVRACVGAYLTPKQREAVEMFFFLGLSQSEIARRLGISQQVVHKRLYGVTRNGRRVGGALRKLKLLLNTPTHTSPWE
jgi:DNA-directed RNA polymerase specialized sigma24 family protein